ncbi:MAG TPA: AAA family ATPase, partial [Ktedonobacterales bacterium]|nr:AAA family ATPase [Ktedonobacterales bacterium]
MHDDGGQILDAEDAALHLRLLGLPKAGLGGSTLILSDQKAQALLFYLAASGQAVSRDHLATLLWSESPESNARHSLRSSLYHLRQSLDADTAATLLVSRNLVHLRLQEDACDVLRFRHLIAANDERDLAEAVALYRGPLLEGVSLADAPVFEDWLRAERATLSRAYLDTLARLAAWAEARESWGDAIAYAQRIIQEDALDERAQQHLMRLYLRSGATVQALRQYHRFESELKRELGLAPSVETKELFQQAAQPAAPHTAPPVATLISRSEQAEARWDAGEWALPFVGRDDLLKQLLALGDDARAGHGSTLLLHGETGMGKTRLLSELEARQAFQSPGWLVLHGSCSPFDDLVSFGPFYDALQSAVSGDLTDLLAAEQATAREEVGTASWRILEALRLLAQRRPLLLAIDDLHWANSSTLHLFGFLATHLRNLP